jgi:hypothetical protein
MCTLAPHAARGGGIVDTSSRGICLDIGEEGLYTPGNHRLYEEEEINVVQRRKEGEIMAKYISVIDEQ